MDKLVEKIKALKQEIQSESIQTDQVNYNRAIDDVLAIINDDNA